MTGESYETTEEYLKESKILFDLVARREEMLRLLKMAQPANVSQARKVIAQLDNLIERTEEIMEMQRALFLKRRKADKNDAELLLVAEKIQIELREYVAKNKPEKLELLDAMLSDDDKTH